MRFCLLLTQILIYFWPGLRLIGFFHTAFNTSQGLTCHETPWWFMHIIYIKKMMMYFVAEKRKNWRKPHISNALRGHVLWIQRTWLQFRGWNKSAPLLAVPPRFRPLDHTRQLRVACMPMMNAVNIDFAFSLAPTRQQGHFQVHEPANLHFCTSERLVERAPYYSIEREFICCIGAN